MRRARLDGGVLASIVVSGALVLVGVVRGLSYLRDPLVGDFVRHSVLGVIAYQPQTWWNAQWFKVLATPSVAGLQYFAFRWFNRGQRRALPHATAARNVDFASPWVRLALTTLATAHWFLIEVAKFHWREAFYPWSPLEDRTTNAVALLTGHALAFFGMRYLRFGPLQREDSESG